MNKLEELRSLFKDKLKDGIPDPPGKFDPRDLERLKDNKYLRRILEHCEGKTDAAVKMLWSIMIWRCNVNAWDIRDTVRMDYVKKGLFFPHGRDVDACLLFIMKWKLYNKGQKNVEDLKKVIVYWLERLEREEDGRPITLFFDLDGCGLNNVDVEIVTYMISLLKSYYPKFVNNIIIYQMPWIMSAGFRIVKGFLPARAVERLRVINKDQLTEFVHPKQALKCWGGYDDYVFQFVPEKINNIPKKVTFADETNEQSSREYLQIVPNDFLTFRNDKNDVKSEFTVTNIDNTYLAFKIRTTGPEKFRVKPSTGVLAPNSSQTITVTVLPGFDPNVIVVERFLVASSIIQEYKLSHKQVGELWRNPSIEVNEKRLKCKLLEREDAGQKSSVVKPIDNFQKKYEALWRSINILKQFELLTLFFNFILVLFGYLMYKRTNQTYCEV
ncbi:unnamed protein product [Parnassius apollo]|uniref:(apollo) hypothetical protein n=1 Tax=Parnassius apollo TaxID=110799 RepID=A0A8S3WDL6_PARAO|nr:unnamed protein product [Parnassius apollo]